jgi:putative Mn2+ efflux pump MntP
MLQENTIVDQIEQYLILKKNFKKFMRKLFFDSFEKFYFSLLGNVTQTYFDLFSAELRHKLGFHQLIFMGYCNPGKKWKKKTDKSP